MLEYEERFSSRGIRCATPWPNQAPFLVNIMLGPSWMSHNDILCEMYHLIFLM